MSTACLQLRIALLIAQTMLVAKRRSDIHRRLGLAGIVLVLCRVVRFNIHTNFGGPVHRSQGFGPQRSVEQSM